MNKYFKLNILELVILIVGILLIYYLIGNTSPLVACIEAGGKFLEQTHGCEGGGKSSVVTDVLRREGNIVLFVSITFTYIIGKLFNRYTSK